MGPRFRLTPAGGAAAWQATCGAAIPVARSIGGIVLGPLTALAVEWVGPALLSRLVAS